MDPRSDYSITNVDAEDIARVKTIEVASGLSPWPVSAYEAEVARNESIFLKAQEPDGTIVGFIVGRVLEAAEAEIYNLGTSPENRRRGIGSRLLTEFLDICLGMKVKGIWLEVRSSNHPAIEFYRSKGFIRKGVRAKFYTNPDEDAEVMSLDITSFL